MLSDEKAFDNINAIINTDENDAFEIVHFVLLIILCILRILQREQSLIILTASS